MIFDIPVFLWTVLMALGASAIPLLLTLLLLAVILRTVKKMYKSVIK
jgi:hypothetical protein